MTGEDLRVVVDEANGIFKLIMSRYPKTKASLVLSSPFGQCELTSNPTKILSSFSKMVQDSVNKDKCIDLLTTISNMEKESKSSAVKNIKQYDEKLLDCQKQLAEVIGHLEYKADTFIEIRYLLSEGGIDTIFAMKKDPLVSQEHTSQSNASIRVVLGTLQEIKDKISNH